MGPALVIYAIKVDVSFSYYIYAILVFLLLPVIPTILASLIGYLVAYLTSKSNSKNWFEMIISFVFILGIFLITSFGNKILSFIIHDMDTILKVLKYGFYPIYLINQVFADNNILSLLIFITINIILDFLFVIILSKSFKKIISKLQESRSKSNYVMKKLKTKSLDKALFIKDVKRYLSSPIYVLNTSIGVVIMLIMAVASLFYDKEKIFAMLNISIKDIPSFAVITLLIAIMSFMSNTACSSISIEGKNFWIIKSLPIEPKKIFNSKILLNMLLVVPAIFVSVIIFKFSFALTIIQVLILILLSIIFTLVSSQFGLLMNLKFPKMDAINDVAIVKQSISVIISTMVPLVLIITTAGIYGQLFNDINFNLFLSIVIFVFIAIVVIERIFLNTWGIKRFKEIN
jgi:ABC-2 type transport system permease protein